MPHDYTKLISNNTISKIIKIVNNAYHMLTVTICNHMSIVVIYCHKFRGLKQIKFIIFQFWGPDVQNGPAWFYCMPSTAIMVLNIWMDFNSE